MAHPQCAKCGGRTFEMSEQEPQGSRYKIMFVHCTSCGAPIGVMDYYNIGNLVKEQERQIGAMSSKIDYLEENMQKILRAFER